MLQIALLLTASLLLGGLRRSGNLSYSRAMLQMAMILSATLLLSGLLLARPLLRRAR